MRKHFLDAVKGISIIFVILIHVNWTGEEELKFLFPFWRNMAVPCFMIISGYVASLSFRKNGIISISKAYNKEMVCPKAFRYTFPFLFVYLVELIVGLPEGIWSKVSIFLGGGYGPGSYYYPIMMQFIFVFPLIYFIIKDKKEGLLICLTLNIIYEILKDSYQMNEECYRLLIFRYIYLIAYGCWIEQKKHINKYLNILSFLLGAIYIYAICYGGYQPKIIKFWSGTSVLAALYMTSLFYFILKLLEEKRFHIFEMIGRASYNIFLIQLLYFYYLYENLSNMYNNRLTEVVVSILICIIGGIFFYHIEKLILKKFR